MWVREYSELYQGINKADIWKIWTDINNWPSWHDDLEYCKMKGDFKEGNFFMLKPKGAPVVKIELIEVNEGHSFTDRTTFLGAKMYDTHSMEETVEGVRLANKLVVKGILQYVWIQLVAKHIANTVPQETEALVALARSKHVR